MCVAHEGNYFSWNVTTLWWRLLIAGWRFFNLDDIFETLSTWRRGGDTTWQLKKLWAWNQWVHDTSPQVPLVRLSCYHSTTTFQLSARSVATFKDDSSIYICRKQIALIIRETRKPYSWSLPGHNNKKAMRTWYVHTHTHRETTVRYSEATPDSQLPFPQATAFGHARHDTWKWNYSWVTHSDKAFSFTNSSLRFTMFNKLELVSSYHTFSVGDRDRYLKLLF